LIAARWRQVFLALVFHIPAMQFPELPLDDAPETLVSFLFEDVVFDLPDQQELVEWLLAIAAEENKPVRELTYVFTSDEYLRQVNIEHLQHDYYTDVITFPYAPDAIYGDVFISSDRVADNAQAHDVPFLHELRRVMAHGLLHLAGYGDKTPEEAQTMRAKEDYYLELGALSRQPINPTNLLNSQ
jgi:probable rRNA maturation factor